MHKSFLLLLAIGAAVLAQGQSTEPKDTSWKHEYRETPTRLHDLVHTKLELKPDFSKSWMDGKAWVTLQPHFYTSDSVILDAKGMELKKVALVQGTKTTQLKYSYDDFQVRIKLDKAYKAGEKFTLYIEYVAKPNEFEEKYARNQMLGIKGLYFINPKGEEKNKPTQIWTQGETESNSAWFPTIDKTNQKTTEELTVTVDNKYVTLSNGRLVSSKKNTDGTRTDYWKMELPHAPYLFFLGVGEYSVTKDSWKGKEVNYYVEPEYASVAKKIFGNTPEMMSFFSRITGVDFPWVKYSQITGRDYVAGAMENTTATIHQNFAQQDARELVDGNNWEETIAHELFHQWFGDYVTTESWSNLTVNESMADYSQTLWEEYKYGKDRGDMENYKGLQGYLQGGGYNKDLVRFYYADREEMFDNVTYQKGGCILHMLRNLVGDSAFFKSLNLYLTTNKFKSAEAHQLRLAFEEVTGRDLNWFFNQWYFGSGHPTAEIDYVYDDEAGKVTVIVKQTQKTGKIFRLPLAIDVWNGATHVRYNEWAQNAVDSFTFSYSKHPDLVNVDADKILLWSKKDNKTIDNYLHQYTFAGKYMDRREAVEFAGRKMDDPKSVELIRKALNDPFYSIRTLALSKISLTKPAMKDNFEKQVVEMAKNDKQSTVRGAAISALAKMKNADYMPIYKAAVKDSSYSVAGAALDAISQLDPAAGLALAKEMNNTPAKGALRSSMMSVFAKSGDEVMFDKVLADFNNLDLQSKFSELQNLTAYLTSMKNTEKFKTGLDAIAKFRTDIPEALRGQVDPYFNKILNDILAAKKEALKASPDDKAMQEQVNYTTEKIEKKGF